MRLAFIILTFSLSLTSAVAQKTIEAVRTNARIAIDGDLKEEAWKAAPVATNFVEWRPAFGNIEMDKNKTEIRFLYDDEAIYISGYCHEQRDSLTTELVGRDIIGVNDFVGVIFDTYQDKINGFGYYITPLGEQFDCKYSTEGEDGSWNSVWASNSRIVHDGWTFEMKIPYSAIRFSSKNVQDWGLNITRKRTKSGKQYMWHPVDPQISGFLNQFGAWKNISNIKPPIRLSFLPYLSAYLDHLPDAKSGKMKTNTSINGGMDVKYGITKAFTLDMTLIPDFGQVQSDNQVLNLSPFEVRFSENRTFFTEGTELFNKGNLFYSRRIGGAPLRYLSEGDTLDTKEVVTNSPTVTKLINATKVSGRTAKGWGLGFFNALVNTANATVVDAAGNEREVEVSPLTNYNIFVVDKTLKNNSSVSFINTSTWRSGKDYDADVAAFLWDFYDKKVTWNFNGKIGGSQLIGYKPDGSTLGGYNYRLGFGKVSGRFNFNISRELTDEKYQQNDLGYFTNNNYLDHYLWLGYRWFEPKGWYNRLNLNFNFTYSERYLPRSYQRINSNININGQLKNLWWFGAIADIRPEQHDFYEPRKSGRMFRVPQSWMKGFWFETNNAKRFTLNAEVYNRTGGKYKFNATDFWLNVAYRFNDRLSIRHTFSYQPRKNSVGFAFATADSSIFGLRKVETVENTFNIKYNFNNKMGLTFRMRHYWSKVENSKYYNLKTDGYLEQLASVNRSANYNANFFNIDMVYTWQFAPGSFINVVWKDAAELFNNDTQTGYFKNFGNTLERDQANSFSVKVIYFLDYLDLKKKNRK